MLTDVLMFGVCEACDELFHMVHMTGDSLCESVGLLPRYVLFIIWSWAMNAAGVFEGRASSMKHNILLDVISWRLAVDNPGGVERHAISSL
jgi:hypothetical protein